MGSFAKRARALVIFTTGIVPAAATAQTSVPECAFSVAPSKAAGVMGHLYTVDDDTWVQGLVQVTVNAGKIKPNNKLLLASPGATLRATYVWRDGTLGSYTLEVGSPYMVKPGQSGPSYDGKLTIEGLSESFTANTYSTRNWNSMVDSNAADKFGALKKDVSLSLAPVAGTSGTAYTFSFAKGDIGKAYKAAQPQLQALLKKAEAGQCKPRRETSSSSSGSACFLTTATCEAVGLDDDCWELRTLRKFRDGWLANQTDGMADIAAYYAKAPAIAERLKSDPRALLRLYWTRIVPSALAAQFGLNEMARTIYSKGMRELAEG